MTVTATYTASPPVTPAGTPSPVDSREGTSTDPRYRFVGAILRILPPWLQRTAGGAIMKGLATPIDDEVNRDVEGVELRFPGGANGLSIHSEALALLGRERRILRGPGEIDETFAARLRTFWDAHRTRGDAYALLGQMHSFFLETNNVPIQYIANSGTDLVVDENGIFTRGSVAGWTGDGEYPAKWARFFLVFYFDSATFGEVLFDEAGDPITTEAGELVLTETPLDALDATQEEIICAVPREWKAAHIDRIYFTLLPVDGYAWDLPEGLVWDGVGLTWDGGGAVSFTC